MNLEDFIKYQTERLKALSISKADFDIGLDDESVSPTSQTRIKFSLEVSEEKKEEPAREEGPKEAII